MACVVNGRFVELIDAGKRGDALQCPVVVEKKTRCRSACAPQQWPVAVGCVTRFLLEVTIFVGIVISGLVAYKRNGNREGLFKQLIGGITFRFIAIYKDRQVNSGLCNKYTSNWTL